MTGIANFLSLPENELRANSVLGTMLAAGTVLRRPPMRVQRK
jgi:hypothetical protein